MVNTCMQAVKGVSHYGGSCHFPVIIYHVITLSLILCPANGLEGNAICIAKRWAITGACSAPPTVKLSEPPLQAVGHFTRNPQPKISE